MIISPESNGWGNDYRIRGTYEPPKNYIWCSKAKDHLAIKYKSSDRYWYKYNTNTTNEKVRVSNPRDHAQTERNIIASSLTPNKAQRVMLALMCKV